MSRTMKALVVASHALLIALALVVALAPNARNVPDALPLWVAIAIVEALFILTLIRAHVKKAPTASPAIVSVVWVLMLLWEIFSTKLNVLSVMIFPAPELVFDVFAQNYAEMAYNALYSLELLATGFLGGVLLGFVLGTVVGWVAPLRLFFHPVMKVLAPIPPMVISPYVVLVMPTFRLASVVLVGITVFMFCFLMAIEEVLNLDREVLDSSRMMHLGTWSMYKDVLLPYVTPTVIGGLKIFLIMGFMMLVYSETLGSPYGVGHWISVNHMHANYANIIAGFIEIGVMVVVLNKLVELLQRKLVVWR